MKRRLYLVLCISVFITGVFCTYLGAQGQGEVDATPKKEGLESKNLDRESQDLDEQILDYAKRIEGIVARYNMLSIKDIRILPYQFDYELGKDYIKLERHRFIRSGIAGPIIGIKRKSLKIYTNGKTITRFESEIHERNYDASNYTVVKIIDPSPTVKGSDDVTFSHTVSGRVFIEKKLMKDIKNSTAFPIRNNIRRDFYIPHLNYFYNGFLNIAETYFKSFKDVDSSLNQFLKKSTKY